jgi:16S rRNA (uracil1498-N3)-methyltransferase
VRRFFIPGILSSQVSLVGDDAHHIMHVLRAKIGQKLIVVDAERQVAEMEITEFRSDTVELNCLRHMDADTEPEIEVTLIQFLPKGDKMDFVVQKAVELGASRIVPVAGMNCVVKYDAAKRQARQKKWQKIADEAAKQCGRTLQPEVMAVTNLKEVLENPEKALLFMCYEGVSRQTIGDFLAQAENERIGLLIGPEGGFSPEEVELCQQHGVQTVTMGPRILRTETAALAALSIVMYQKGDLGGRSK